MHFAGRSLEALPPSRSSLVPVQLKHLAARRMAAAKDEGRPYAVYGSSQCGILGGATAGVRAVPPPHSGSSSARSRRRRRHLSYFGRSGRVQSSLPGFCPAQRNELLAMWPFGRGAVIAGRPYATLSSTRSAEMSAHRSSTPRGGDAGPQPIAHRSAELEAHSRTPHARRIA